MARARNLEEDLLLALEQDFAVVHAPRGEHDAIRVNELLTGQALIGLGLFRNVGFVQLGIDFGRGHAVCLHPTEFQPRNIVNQVSVVRSQVLRKIFSSQMSGISSDLDLIPEN